MRGLVWNDIIFIWKSSVMATFPKVQLDFELKLSLWEMPLSQCIMDILNLVYVEPKENTV